MCDFFLLSCACAAKAFAAVILALASRTEENAS